MFYSTEYLQTLLTTRERNTQEILLQTLGNYSRQGILNIFTIFLCIALCDDSHFVTDSPREHSNISGFYGTGLIKLNKKWRRK